MVERRTAACVAMDMAATVFGATPNGSDFGPFVHQGFFTTV